MKQILNAVTTLLKQGIPTLKYIDENWGQLDVTERPSVRFPAVLVDMYSAQWNNKGARMQVGVVLMRIVVADLPLNKDKKDNIYDLMHSVHTCLHGFCPDESRASNFRRATSSLIRRQDGIRQYEVMYQVVVSEEPAQANTTPVIVQPKII
jgi:hypothetical protein